MSIAVAYSRALCGVDAPAVAVEVHCSGGLPGLTMVGMPETAVRESKDRVRSALLMAGFAYPARRVTVNLAPAELPKSGGRFDLPIAIALLAASGQLPPQALGGHEFVGELALDGTLRAVRGALPSILAARDAGRSLVLPPGNEDEAALVPDAHVLAARALLPVTAHLAGDAPLPRIAAAPPARSPEAAPDLADVRGQHHAKRALEIAAAGNHHLLLAGPPGTGKSMLAQRLPGLLPPMTDAEALESAATHSVAGLGVDPDRWRVRPYRAPHHTASAVALVGGGSPPQPGEISLAHHGVLFLDELPEFQRRVLEVLREPLELGRVSIVRAAQRADFPARFLLAAAMNPCPCGYLGDPSGRCRCTGDQVQRYRARVSGPLLDRIDLHVEVPRPDPRAALDPAADEPSSAVRERVGRARARQLERGAVNSALQGDALLRHTGLAEAERRLLQTAAARLGLSARGTHRALRVARTIADLAGSESVLRVHLQEALGYRPAGADDRSDPALRQEAGPT